MQFVISGPVWEYFGDASRTVPPLRRIGLRRGNLRL
ncbi:hypothetical protein PO124_25380 [Bacillus licheniformis]|nr:hypothetical protein [Bacillus licheniformis]